MTTETTDPLEQAVMEAVSDFALTYAAKVVNRDSDLDVITDRLRLHVQLALAKARRTEHVRTCRREDCGRGAYLHDEIAALEARLQEQK